MQRAVGFNRNKAALCSEPLSLGGDYLYMLRVKLRNNHRNVGSKAVGAVVGDNRTFVPRVFLLKSLYFVLFHSYGAENEVNKRYDFVDIALSVVNSHIFQLFRNRLLHCPAASDCLLIGLSGT